MTRWYVPCRSGDFRLEQDSDEATESRLTVEDPTELDLARLRAFLVEARKQGWVDTLDGVMRRGRTEIRVMAPVHIAGPHLSGVVYTPGTALWRVLRSVDGVISVQDTDAHRLIEEARKAEEVKEAAAVATVQTPRRGCPAPVAARRRASEVLAAFSTPEQIEELQRHGRMRAIGNATGKAYHVYHRDEAARRGLAHCLVDCETREDICVWDNRVPAEEELLSLKLAVEHREGWLLGQGRPRPRLRSR